ncbi:extracellular solute-binding protein [Paenibacillus cremeus]|uniref:Extracellular solute-binding protein n=1 Tax=Paenibacillus cremeus TaxID=2163881 RepID=A0A559K6L9_9BACL|nr:extracellular solute-binding protein [Paenibacillus cremeus]TVY07770.1 extracellular solute-binding protein [Paenibacillus cremeus]
MKKGMSMLLIAGLTVSVLEGCSGGATQAPAGGSAPASTPSGTQQQAPQAQAPVKQTFTMLDNSHPSWPYDKNAPVWKMLEEKTGVTLDVQVPSGNIADTLSITIASGNLPDIMYTPDKKLADKYGQQGALVNILEHVNEMPNLKKWMEKYPTETQNAIAADGKMYILPNEGIGETNRMNWMYREDVFKKLGIALPQNWDDLYGALKKIKAAYPNSYPFAYRAGTDSAILYLRNFAPAFNTGWDYYYDFDKKEWRYGPTEDNFKTMVTYLNKFYKEGLIPPDFMTVDTKQWQDLMSTERAFVTVDYIGRIDFFNTALRKSMPEYNLAFMPTPAGVNGFQKNAFTQYVESGLMVSSTSKKLKDVLKYIDFFYSDEGRTLTSWGKEGTTFKNEGGKKTFIEKFADVSDLRKKTGLSTDGTYAWFDYDAHLSLSSPELQVAYKEAPKYDSKQQPRPAFNAQETEVLTTVGDVITKKRDENLSKFIMGTRSLEEWPKYVDEMKKLGIDKTLDIYKKAYERSAKK